MITNYTKFPVHYDMISAIFKGVIGALKMENTTLKEKQFTVCQ